MLLSPLLAGCSKDDAEARAAAADAENGVKTAASAAVGGRATVEIAGLPTGTYLVESGERIRGDTLRLLPSPGAFYATITPPGAAYGNDVYEGSVAPAGGGMVRLAFTCHCKTGVTAFGQARYGQTSLGGTFQVRPLGGDRFELGQTDGNAVYTIAKLR